MKKNILLLTSLILAASPLYAQEQPSVTSDAPRMDFSRQSYASLIDQVQPTVVSIIAAHPATKETFNPSSLTSDNPALRDYFITDDDEKASYGSGFIIDAKGNIITNYHVIKGSDKITVTLSNGDTHEAKVIGGDEPT